MVQYLHSYTSFEGKRPIPQQVSVIFASIIRSYHAVSMWLEYNDFSHNRCCGYLGAVVMGALVPFPAAAVDPGQTGQTQLSLIHL